MRKDCAAACHIQRLATLRVQAEVNTMFIGINKISYHSFLLTR